MQVRYTNLSFVVTTGTLITATAPPVSTKWSPKVTSVTSTILPASTTSSHERQTTKATTFHQ
jgi:hypothetical protein